ncbi:hypothetical protein BJX68DRAFT_268339 [Aspergillus pseudodeflectus]|uniref:Uncharacterized protein n=1 Tax=Aspergillus pseudodeflectus TaxID=176178 RepID=A0ABR4K490_9EURO
MANQRSLMEYLQVGMPNIPSRPPREPRENTANRAYSYRQINDITPWAGFDVPTIQQVYPLLATATIDPNPLPTSPPQTIRSENGFKARVHEYAAPRIRRGLRSIYQTSQFLKKGPPPNARPNRAPGDLKPHWKWHTNMQFGSPTEQAEYRQALSQVNWYMKQNQTRYGFIMTDHELVAIRRLDDNGNLELSPPIPWDAQGTVAQPRMTVLLALWYLGMLASQNQGAGQWKLLH